MNRRPPVHTIENVIVVLATLACTALLPLMLAWYYDRSDRWNRVVAPAGETVTEIVALNRALMPYVKTQQGNLYFCSGVTWRDTCTPITPGELPVRAVHPKWLTCPPPFPETPPLPGTVVSAFEVGECAEAQTYAKVVLLDDGSVWQWQRTFSWVQPFTLATCAVLGLMLGLAGGKFIVKLARALR